MKPTFRISHVAICHPHTATLALMLVASATISAKEVTVGLNFTGANRSQSGFIPPDTMGTVGRDHIVELINGRYRVYSKSSGQLLRGRTLDFFWQRAGATPSGAFAFDPRVQYDPSVGRFFATSVDNAGGANNFLFAVSNTTNPLDGWTGFRVDADSDDQQWADFPQMGYSDDAVIVSANMFPINNGDFEINMLVLPKADLVTATPSIANSTLLEDLYAPTGFEFSLQAAVDLENAGRPLRLFATDSSRSQLGVVQIDNPLTSPTLNNIPNIPGLGSYPSPPLADQPGPKQNLEAGGARTRSALTLIDGHYYGINGVRAGGRAALRWYKLDADTLSLAEEGIIGDPDLDFIYGSIAANELGDVVIGFTGTGANQFPSSYAVVGETNPVSSSLNFGSPILLKQGLSDYQALDGSDRNRWGDYSSTVLDPVNPLKFWTFQEFVQTTDNWAIQITELTLTPSGDFNGDGIYGCLDVDALVAEIVSGSNLATFDLTTDGLVNTDDLDAWLREAGEVILGPGKAFLPGDADLDGLVDGSDFSIWNANKFTVRAAWCAGDFNADGQIDGSDFSIWNSGKFTSSDLISVPEPAVYVPLLVAAGCLLIRRR